VILPGAQKDLLLVQGEDGWMQMYDARTGKMLVETKTDVTQNNLLSTTFFHQDQYLLLTTKDSQMFVYDTDTLEEVKRYRFTGQEFDRPAFVQEDEKNHRAYLSCDGAAVCVDMRSWETLFEIDNFLYFDEKDGEVYQYDSRYSGDGLLVVTKVPSMEELADRCRQMLEENGG
jgi:glutamine cyclotransferase